MTTAVHFQNFNGPVYAGRARGVDARKQVQLDLADSRGDDVDVFVPEGTYTVTSSFFLGLFGPSVLKEGSQEAFLKRFHFKNIPEFLQPDIDKYIGIALQSRNLFE